MAIISIVIVVAGGIVWWLLTRQPAPEGAAPKEFAPIPPYAKGAPVQSQPPQTQ